MNRADCVANTIGTLAIIKKWIKGLHPNINISNRDDLHRVEELFKKGKREILGDGLTQETCMAMAMLLEGLEEDAQNAVLECEDADMDRRRQNLNWYEGLRRIHDKMGLLIPEDMNEGGKDCCPFCSGC